MATSPDLVSLYYNLVRPQSEAESVAVLHQFRSVARSIFCSDQSADWDRGGLIALVLQTRDLAGGKGEYNLFYLLMGELYLLATEDADQSVGTALLSVMSQILRAMVHPVQGATAPQRPYGCWRDYRACLSHIAERAGHQALTRTTFFRSAICDYVEQLKRDVTSDRPSLLGRWAPRERSTKYGWLARHVAGAYAESVASEARPGTTKCLAQYRSLVSRLNRKLQTVEVKQCAGEWADIDFEKRVPARAMRKYRKAFLYPGWEDPTRTTDDPDRTLCRRAYLGYLRDCARGTTTMKRGGLSPRTLVKDAISVLGDEGTSDQELALARSAVDLQWWRDADGEADGQKAVDVIPVLICPPDEQGVYGDAAYAALGLSLRLAERSRMGHRLLTFGSEPAWVNLDGTTTLSEAVAEVLRVSSKGGPADLFAALALVANACVEEGLSCDEVEAMRVVILSDTGGLVGSANAESPLHHRISALFADAGLRSPDEKPYPCPQIVYWGLRTGQPLPCVSMQAGATMLAGYQESTLGSLCSTESLMARNEPASPARALRQILSGTNRYSWAWTAATEIPRPELAGGWLW